VVTISGNLGENEKKKEATRLTNAVPDQTKPLNKMDKPLTPDHVSNSPPQHTHTTRNSLVLKKN